MRLDNLFETKNTSYDEYINKERYLKRRYNEERKKQKVKECITFVPFSVEELNDLYDLFIEYSTMEKLDEIHFWKCLSKLNYPFSKYKRTCLHTYIYKTFCNLDPLMTIHQFVIAVAILRNQMSISRNRVILTIMNGYDIGPLWKQLPFHMYTTTINNKDIVITNVIYKRLYDSISKSHLEVSEEKKSQFETIFLLCFDW